MILNDDLNFLFVIPKTSGAEGIITGNRDLNTDPDRLNTIMDYLRARWPDWAGTHIQPTNLPAWAIRDALIDAGELTQEQWDNLDKWTVIRNPWDRVFFNWRIEHNTSGHEAGNKTFMQWLTGKLQETREILRTDKLGPVRRRLPRHFTYRMVVENPENETGLYSDFKYLYYHDLADGWGKLCHHLNRRARVLGLNIRVNPDPGVVPARNPWPLVSETFGQHTETIRLVQDIFEPDIEFFGWLPPDYLEVPPGLLRNIKPRIPQGKKKRRYAEYSGSPA